MRDYEMVVIMRPDIPEENIQASVDNLSQLITSRGGVVNKIEPGGRKKLAFPVKRFNEGSYFLAQFKLEPKLVSDLEKPLRISQDILRHQIVSLGN